MPLDYSRSVPDIAQSVASCLPLAEDVDLAEAVPADSRALATESFTAPLTVLAPGPWTPPPPLAGDAIGFLVLRGLLMRGVGIDERLSVELLGEGDILRPRAAGYAITVSMQTSWKVVTPTRLALLDGQFTRQLANYPELAGALFERTVRRSRDLAAHLAIASHTRVDTRLHLLLWHLARRWGRVTPDGVVIPIRLTHAVLADLVAARRPTVTSALSELSARGLVRASDDGWLLIGEPPRSVTDA
jgi:CRP-like cAMP-binding protein